MKVRKLFAIVGMLLAATAARAAITASWISPVSGTSFIAGSIVNPGGNANASGTIGGTGLDLALVLDSSSSMATIVNGQSRRVWMQQASTALVNALPTASTSVSVVDFDADAVLLRSLTPLTTGRATVIAGINSVDASGGTNIGTGIDRARTELVGSNQSAGRAQMMVVISDGESSGVPAQNAASAVAAGVDAVHTVGIPGHSVPTMQAIATAGGGIYTNGNNLATLISLFNGTGGNLVGVGQVDVTMNDGSFISAIAIDGLGNFVLPAATIAIGDNVFTATAYDTLGSSATATLTLVGTVPEPNTYALFAVGAAVLASLRQRQWFDARM